MALLACPDCNSEVSDQAPACPKCGRPIAGVAPTPPAAAAQTSPAANAPTTRAGISAKRIGIAVAAIVGVPTVALGVLWAVSSSSGGASTGVLPPVTEPEVAAPARAAPRKAAAAAAGRNTSTFQCGPSQRCNAGQRCCPGASEACIGISDLCGDGSETTVGYECDPASGDPCARGEKCRIEKQGHGPLTMTAACGK